MATVAKDRRSNMPHSSVKQTAKKDGAGAYGWGDRQISGEYDPVGIEGPSKVITHAPVDLTPVGRADSYHGDVECDAQFPSLGGVTAKPQSADAKAAPKVWGAPTKKVIEPQGAAPTAAAEQSESVAEKVIALPSETQERIAPATTQKDSAQLATAAPVAASTGRVEQGATTVTENAAFQKTSEKVALKAAQKKETGCASMCSVM